MNEYSYLSTLARWALLDGNRLLITGIVLSGIFALNVVLGSVGVLVVTDASPVMGLLTGLLGGTLPFITLVVGIIQLILSQQFGGVGNYRSSLEASRDLFKTVAGETETELTAEADRATTRLANAEFGTFDAVSVILDYDDARQLDRTYRLQSEGTEMVSDEIEETLDEIATIIETIHIAHLYFKSVYAQQELADLSALLSITGFLALLVGSVIAVSYENVLAFHPGRPALVVVVSAAITVLFAPFVVFLVYLFRIALVARRTAADFGPFLLQRGIPGETPDKRIQ